MTCTQDKYSNADSLIKHKKYFILNKQTNSNKTGFLEATSTNPGKNYISEGQREKPLRSQQNMMGGSDTPGSRQARLRQEMLAVGMWVLEGKEPKLLREVECYQLDLMGLNSHRLGSGTVLLDRGWTLFYYCSGQTVPLEDFNTHGGDDGDTVTVEA